MDIALVGREAELFCHSSAVKSITFSSISRVTPRRWQLLALAPDALRADIPPGLRAENLLLPGNSAPAAALRLCTGQIVGYGFSPRDTLTLSSFTGEERLLCLQRSLLTLGGTLLEPQELPLPSALAALPPEAALLAAGVRLFCSV